MNVDLPSLGWDGEFAATYRLFDRPYHRPARVARVDRGVCTTLAADGPGRASLGGAVLDRAAHDPVQLPCTGDWIAVRDWPDHRTTIEGVLPRRTAVVRATAGKAAAGQVIAANITAAAVVEPLDPAPDPGRIERLLALAWDCGAPPLVILTKADLLADPAAVAASLSAVTTGVPVNIVSTVTGEGLDALRAQVRSGQTLGLIGASGSGKSSLVNALVGAEAMGIRELRADGRGRHTTTYRALVPVPGGGAVLDTPGVRVVGMFDATAGLARAFDDIARLAQRCRFIGCRHLDEPGCAVLAAVESGDLPPRRLANWRKLKRELSHELRRRDARVTATELHRWRRAERGRRSRP
jgi:ribosome biogenesis GTPase / thiamine phosphate phosphatase